MRKNKEEAKEYSREYYQKHKEEIKEAVKKYYSSHKEGYSKQGKEYREEHKEELKDKKREYQVQHRKEIKEYKKVFYEEHKEKIDECNRKWREEHREETRIYSREYQIAHPDQRYGTTQKYNKSEHGKRIRTITAAARRAIGAIMYATMQELQKEYAGACPYCNRVITRGSLDHLVPVHTGGANARENLVWCCHSCNSSKSDDSLIRFMLRTGGRGIPEVR